MERVPTAISRSPPKHTRPETHQNLIHISKDQHIQTFSQRSECPPTPQSKSQRRNFSSVTIHPTGHRQQGHPTGHRQQSQTANPPLNTQPKANRPGIGGGERVRTDDPLLAKQVLSQLSYTPKSQTLTARNRGPGMVGQGGFEPPTPRLSSVCSNQLSY
jgi:hypothetical protein